MPRSAVKRPPRSSGRVLTTDSAATAEGGELTLGELYRTGILTEAGEITDGPPLKPQEVALLLNVAYRTVFEIVGLEWVEYETLQGKRPIRRITRESVRRLLARRRGRT
jgi:hypothetical protein